MASTNLQIDHPTESQAQKATTTATALQRLEDKMTNQLSISVSTADVTLTDAQANQNGYIKTTGTLDANRNLIVPARKQFYVVEHASAGGFTITVKTAAGSGVALNNGDIKFLYCDGTNVVGPIT